MKKVITHNGSFHTDDVFAVATLQLHFGVENVEIIRTRDESVIATGDIVVDVGGVYDPDKQLFDHHQNGAPVRDNNIPYAAFGLIWKHYGLLVSGSSEVADEIEHRLVLPIDANDVGLALYELNDKNVSPATVQDIISLWRPRWGSGDNVDEAFTEVCSLAREILARSIAHAKSDLEQKQYVETIYQTAEDKRVLIFDKPVSTFSLMEHEEVLAAVYPSEEGDRWSAVMIRKDYHSFEPRAKFPEAWTGLRNSELASVSGVPGALFCHKTGYLFAAKSREGVLTAIGKALS